MLVQRSLEAVDVGEGFHGFCSAEIRLVRVSWKEVTREKGGLECLGSVNFYEVKVVNSFLHGLFRT